MSASAFMLNELNQLVLVDANNFSSEYISRRFFCPGDIADSGVLCLIPVLPALAEDGSLLYFYQASRQNPHKPLCPHCRARKKISVEKLDRRGLGKTREKLFDKLTKPKKRRGKRPASPEIPTDSEGTEQDPPSDSIPPNTEEREIQARPRTPNSIEEYATLLSILSIHDKYMDSFVFDQILDERTVDSYRRMGLPTGVPIVINARRTLPYQHDIKLKPDQWLLVDYWAIGKQGRYPILFILTVTPDAQARLIDLCRIEPSAKITIYTKLTKHPTIPRAYITDLIDTAAISGSMN